MTWQNPLAWIGLAALAVPILVHLFTRKATRRIPFPTLRFLALATQSTTRQWQLTDVTLLAVRASIVALAVAALAQPLVMTDTRTATMAGRVSRVVILDVSASMGEPARDGAAPIDAARQRATALADEADISRVVESQAVGADLAGAAAWLTARGGRRELIVISDFQAGAISPDDPEAVPATIGLRFIPFDTTTPRQHSVSFRRGDRETIATISADPGSTVFQWQTREPSERDPAMPMIFAGPSGREDLDALAATGRRLAPAGAALGGPIGIVLPDEPTLPDLLARARPLDQPWMFDVVDVLRSDDAVRRLARPAGSDNAVSWPASLTPVVSGAAGRPVVRAGVAEFDGVERLLLFLDTASRSPHAAAAIVLAGIPAWSDDVTELEPDRIDAASLEGWARPAPAPTAGSSMGDDGLSDGTWLWLVALVLLGVESWLRRERVETPATAADADEVRDARVA
jgi:hypothetical protein